MTYCPHCDETHGEGVDFCPKTGRPIVDVVDRMVGRTIAGKYKLKRCIGQGGMGTIFEAEHTLIGSRVAVKLLHEPFAEKREPVQRLYREAKATGVIGHPNIIKVFDVGETSDGVPFLVMELLKGESLGDHIEKQGPRPLGFVLDVAIQMLSALHAAHEAGIIHRDLKSDNVFLIENEEGGLDVKLLDFGISKFVSPEMENLKLTQTGSVLGTPYYMSPEQASGKKDLDQRIDIYSAGVIVYESLIGTIPHSASNYNALLIEIISQDVKPFRWLRPDVPERLEKAVLKAMSRMRSDRWAGSVDFMDELVSIRESIPTEVLHGEPKLKRDIPIADRNSRTLDISEVSFDEMTGVPMAFETGGKSTFGLRGSGVKKKMAIGFLASFAVVGAIAFVFMYLLRDPPAQGAPLLNATSGGENSASESLADTGASTQPAEDTDQEAAQTVSLKVVVNPEEAVVTAGGKEIPTGGAELPKGTEPIEVVARAEGHEPKSMTVIPSSDIDLQIDLQAVAKPEKKRPWKKGSKKPNGSEDSGDKGSGEEVVSPQAVKTLQTGKDPLETPKKPPKKDDEKIDKPMDNPF